VHGSICEILSGLASEDAMVCERLTGRARKSRHGPAETNIDPLACDMDGSFFLRKLALEPPSGSCKSLL
jgi:hypothetical protein